MSNQKIRPDTQWCFVCGKEVKSRRAAWSAHCRKHVREGKMRETIDLIESTKGSKYPRYEYTIVSGTRLIVRPKQQES